MLHDIEKFRFYAHKVLPLVYDDSLSYYEFLCKVVAKLNEVIELADTQNLAIEEVIQAEEDFEASVNERYDEFTTHIDETIDAFEREIREEVADFEGDITTQQNQFEYNMGNRQTSFEGDMVARFTDFLEDYQRSFGIEDRFGNSRTEAISQRAVSQLVDFEENNNLLNPETDIDGYFVGSNGVLQATTNGIRTTSYIPVSAGNELHFQYDYNGVRYDSDNNTVDITPFAFIAGYSDIGVFVTGSYVTGAKKYTVPSGCTLIRVSYPDIMLASPYGNVSLIVGDGTVTPYVPYGDQNVRIKEDVLPEITPEMTTFAVSGGLNKNGNLIYPEDVENRVWINYLNGNRTATTYMYSTTKYIEIEPNESYTMLLVSGGGTSLYSYAFYDENKTPIEGHYGRTIGLDHFVAPSNAKYLCYCYQAYTENIPYPEMIKGETPVDVYTPPVYTPLRLPDSAYIEKEYVDEMADEINNRIDEIEVEIPANKISLELADSYELVAYDTFELFWKGVIKATRPENLFVNVICNKGKSFRRKFVYRPISTETGTYTMTVELYNNNGDLLDRKTTNLVVMPVAQAPSTEKVVLYVSDSLANSGYVPDEFERRLCRSGGTPAGQNLGNISFIGTNESIRNAVKYVGNGGWSWASYNSAMSTNAYMWITCTHTKTSADQHSIYKASNDTEWKLETIETGRIKIIRTSGTSALPATGTLTWVSGGDNQATITYTASEQAAGNPFWDETQNKISFANFVATQNKTNLNYMYVLLGWNSTGSTEEGFKTQVRTFIDNVLADFPNCKIVLLGLEIPAEDGLANNYGQTYAVLSNYQKTMEYVFNVNKWYDEISKENGYVGKVYYVNVSGQFDTEYNMPTITTAVNTRNATTVTQQSNGVHPAESGYYQIADACYRDFIHKLYI